MTRPHAGRAFVSDVPASGFFFAGRHRHGQDWLLAALRVARTPQQRGRPH